MAGFLQRLKSRQVDEAIGPMDTTAPASKTDLQEAMALGSEAGGLSAEEAKQIREFQSGKSGIKDKTDEAGRAETFDEIQAVKAKKAKKDGMLSGISEVMGAMGEGMETDPIRLAEMKGPKAKVPKIDEEYNARRQALMKLAGRSGRM